MSGTRTPVLRVGGTVLGFMLAVGTAFAADSAAPLALDLIVPPVVAADVPRDIAVRVTNKSTAPLLVLTNMLRLRIEGRRAEYVPTPDRPWTRGAVHASSHPAQRCAWISRTHPTSVACGGCRPGTTGFARFMSCRGT